MGGVFMSVKSVHYYIPTVSFLMFSIQVAVLGSVWTHFKPSAWTHYTPKDPGPGLTMDFKSTLALAHFTLAWLMVDLFHSCFWPWLHNGLLKDPDIAHLVLSLACCGHLISHLPPWSWTDIFTEPIHHGLNSLPTPAPILLLALAYHGLTLLHTCLLHSLISNSFYNTQLYFCFLTSSKFSQVKMVEIVNNM